MRLKFFFLTIGAAMSLTWPSSVSPIQADAEQAIKNAIGGDVVLEFRKYPIAKKEKEKIERIAGQKFFRDEVYLWKAKSSKGEYKALLDNVLGKALPITFLVIFSEDNKIVHSQIIRYREPIGGAVENPAWNKQFVGMSMKSEFELGKNIDGITGATISVRQVTKGIHKLCLLAPTIK